MTNVNENERPSCERQLTTNDFFLSLSRRVGQEDVSIDLFEGDNVRNVAMNFISSRGIPDDQLETLVRLISERIAADESLLVNAQPTSEGNAAAAEDDVVSVDVTITVPLTFKIGESLETAALRFCQQHGLDANRFQQVLVNNIAEKADVLSAMQRSERVVAATLTVTVDDGREVSLRHFEGDDPLQTVVRFCVDENLDVNSYQPVLTDALMKLLASQPR